MTEDEVGLLRGRAGVAQGRLAVDVEGHVGSQHLGDGRQDVDREHVGVVDPAGRLAGFLQEEGDQQQVGSSGQVEVLATQGPDRLAGFERHAVVGHDHDQGIVVEVLGAQCVQEVAEEPVEELELEDVALTTERRRPLLIVPLVFVDEASDVGVRAPVGPSGRQTGERQMRQEYVCVVERSGV